MLVLDQASAPKWKLGCNRCDVIVRLFEDAAKVTVLADQSCSECDAQALRVEYKEGKSKLADEKITAEGCIFCEANLSALVEKHHAVFMRRRQGAGGGGSAAARGKGKRGGRGRGRKAPKDKMSQLAAYFV